MRIGKCFMMLVGIGFLLTVVRYALTRLGSYVKATEEIETVVIGGDDALFKEKPLVIWSNDYHISPIYDLKNLLSPLGVRFIDKSLSSSCDITKTCSGQLTLRVIGVANAMDLDATLVPQFYEAYKDDAEMKSVDAFVCFHPTSMCELFESFNKSLIMIASTRYELGRFGKERWTDWNRNLVRYASVPWNIVAGNNLYDVEYMKYFTGVQPELLPSFCDYNKISYSQTRKGFLVAPIHRVEVSVLFFTEYIAACAASNCNVEVTDLRTKYEHYEYSDLTSHMGMIYVPYQVSVMSMLEQYRMNIPLFFPSIDLLARWQLEHMVMNERTWDGVGGLRPNRSVIDPHPSQSAAPDPNDETNEMAIRYWIKFSDFYQMPYITYYDSVPHLVEVLGRMKPDDLWQISNRMKAFNVKLKQLLIDKWTNILKAIAAHSLNKPY